MPSWGTLSVVVLAGLAFSASPGPSMFYVLSRSLAQGRAAGFASSLGLAVGGMLLAVLSALGLAALFIYSATAYALMKGLGGLYLIYLGVRMALPSKGGAEAEAPAPKPASFRSIFAQGILVELLNPKTILFFLAYLPQFVDPRRGSVRGQMLVLGLLVPLTAIPSDLVVTLAGGALARGLARSPRATRALEWTGARFLAGLGVRILAF